MSSNSHKQKRAESTSPPAPSRSGLGEDESTTGLDDPSSERRLELAELLVQSHLSDPDREHLLSLRVHHDAEEAGTVLAGRRKEAALRTPRDEDERLVEHVARLLVLRDLRFFPCDA